MIRTLWEFSKNLLQRLGMRYSGLLTIMTKGRLSDRVPVLMYHRVINEELAPHANSSPGIVVSEETFDMHMRTLRRYFTPISLAEFQEHLQHETARSSTELSRHV